MVAGNWRWIIPMLKCDVVTVRAMNCDLALGDMIPPR